MRLAAPLLLLAGCVAPATLDDAALARGVAVIDVEGPKTAPARLGCAPWICAVDTAPSPRTGGVDVLPGEHAFGVDVRPTWLGGTELPWVRCDLRAKVRAGHHYEAQACETWDGFVQIDLVDEADWTVIDTAKTEWTGGGA